MIIHGIGLSLLYKPPDMKTKIFLLSMLIAFATAVSAQDNESTQKASSGGDDEIQALFKKGGHPVKVGFFIGPEAAYTQFKGRDVFLGGLSMGVIIDHFFSVGLAGYGILNSGNLWYDNIDQVTHEGAYLYGGYGGVKFEFRVLPKYPVHVNFPITIGGGGLVYNTGSYRYHNYYEGYTIDWDAFFMVEPGVMVEVNLLKFMRLDAGVTYRYTPDLDLMNTSSGLINNFNASLSLKFGKF